jgi:hypothetical protein
MTHYPPENSVHARQPWPKKRSGTRLTGRTARAYGIATNRRIEITDLFTAPRNLAPPREFPVFRGQTGGRWPLRYSSGLLLATLFMMGGGNALAQHGPPPGGTSTPIAPQTTGSMSQSDISGLADFVDSTSRLERKDLVSKAEATKRSKIVLTALHVGCPLTDAQHLASGRTTAGGKPIDVGLYEVACGNGMGYLLTLVGLSSASGISCFAASAAQQGDAVDPVKVDLKCRLPANENLNTMATTVMRNAGTACDAHSVKWLGQSGTPRLDYTEVACNDDQGFVLRTPAPGSIASIDVLSCKDAASHGAQCQLSAAAPAVAAAATPAAAGAAPSSAEPRPNLQWFKDALSKNGVSCDVKKARIVGRESIKRRYIVEYQCPQQPRGVVAYVPSAGDSTNPFESIDCDAAALRKIACQFVDVH